MPTIADNAVCLRRWDFSETSQTISLLTREHGLIRALAKGAKRERGAFSGGLDPLTRGQMVAIVKPGRELATLTQWTLEEVYWSLRRDLTANRAGLYMADVIHHMLTPGLGEPHSALFDAFIRALSQLESRTGGQEIGGTVLRFQWSLLHETGYEPRLESESETSKRRTIGAPSPGVLRSTTSKDVPASPSHRLTVPPSQTPLGDVFLFSPASGGLVEEGDRDRPRGAVWRVRRETIELLRRISTGDFDKDDFAGEADAKQRETIDRANRLLAAYIREVLGQDLPTLEWAFPGLRP